MGGQALTVERGATGASRQGRWDSLITELHHLREAAGSPSYEALTRSLIRQRMAEGQSEHQARIAKSSVHDAFRFGRSRINETLVRELVCVLGGDAAVVTTWVRACDPPAPSAWAPRTAPGADEPLPTADLESAPVRQQVFLALACVALNLAGREFVDYFHLPVFLDMVGTAVAAIALGPWKGAGVGAATNIVGIIGSGWISLPFALVNVVGALMWGYGVRRWGMGRTLPRFFLLNVLTAVACSVIAVPIILAFLSPELRVGHDAITVAVSDSINGFAAAVSFANLVTSLGDKLVSGFAALVVVSALPVPLRSGVDLVAVGEKGS